MTNNTQGFEALKQYMIDNGMAKTASGGKELVKRCHICGDSRDHTDAHMYIGCRNGVIVYNCFKCNARGVVDAKFLRDIDCYDQNIMYLCQMQNNENSGSKQYNSGSLRNYIPKSLLIPISNNDFAIKKIQYIENRLGFTLTQEYISAFKIILNLKDFLSFNNITKYTRDPEMVDLIDKFFVGFLSADNRYVILRRLIPEGKLPKFIDTRYIVYNIFGRNDGIKYYAIPGSIDMTRPVSIHIAEGVFDIISIYANLPRIDNSMYLAISGKSYSSIIQYVIMTYGIVCFDLHIYPDADISNSEMMKIKNELSIFNIRIFIHRNGYNGEKDYGVSKDRIIDNIVRIK